MNIIVGSKNPTKVNAVQAIFKDAKVIGLDVPSLVSAQPFSDEETREGAINRAKQCAKSESGSVGIGLEGGVMYVGEELYLCNWGALVTPNGEIYTASGARVLLPQEIETKLKKGIELGVIMDEYAHKQGVSKKEGAIGIFTNEQLNRQDMFSQVVVLLKGQWEYWGNK
jgi:inosine/xanthosine triphosphatase